MSTFLGEWIFWGGMVMATITILAGVAGALVITLVCLGARLNDEIESREIQAQDGKVHSGN